ncbi:GntR family transcriptional regulator [Paenibacillus sp. WQ 127069]|uniref:GntR family transcriptional regulator n=1 Tax=Paenibacillus baimaensis TaxID=2982185 RepID=A0ABT2UKD9_9BACL|nr:GntR family transcriptional regulator [Paenibacillus sp. WQ 127069]MCU6795108.1 GntR family transcriptional regulator [Paenibacillus sp. WQ 127069]
MSKKPLPKYIQLKQEIMGWLRAAKIMPNERMPTEHEIADQFGMSRQTVRQALGELEQEGWLYRVQGSGTYVAPAPKPKREIQTIGVLTTYISDYIFPSIVRGVENVLRSRGYRMLLSSTDNDKARERESLQMLLTHPLAGIIIEPTKSAEGNPNLDFYLSLEYRSIPFLMINERYMEMDCPCIKMDDEAGGYTAVEHLIKLGHRRIAGFFKMDDLQGVNRMKGFIRAHHEWKVPLLPHAVIHYTTEEKQTKPYADALSMLSQDDERPTAFVCYNDELAVQLIGAIREAGLTVPGDVSVVGYDDSTLATAMEVKLTTLAHPKLDLGIQAAETLIDMIEHKQSDTADRSKIWKPELIVRESTRPV